MFEVSDNSRVLAPLVIHTEELDTSSYSGMRESDSLQVRRNSVVTERAYTFIYRHRNLGLTLDVVGDRCKIPGLEKFLYTKWGTLPCGAGRLSCLAACIAHAILTKCGPAVNGYVVRLLCAFPLPWENLDSIQLFLATYAEDICKVHTLESGGEKLVLLSEKVGVFNNTLKTEGTIECVNWLLVQKDGCFVLQLDGSGFCHAVLVDVCSGLVFDGAEEYPYSMCFDSLSLGLFASNQSVKVSNMRRVSVLILTLSWGER